MRYRRTFRITLDGRSLQQRGWMVAVANTEGYAGGMRIAPRARPDDGRLHVCLVGDGSRVDIARTLPRVYSGRHVTHPHFHAFEARTVEIACDRPHPLLIDGEIAGWLPAAMSVEAGALEVLGEPALAR